MSDRPFLEAFRLHPEALLPTLAYGESAAWDLSAYLLSSDKRPLHATVAPHETKLIGTGLALRAPLGSVILICSRSGLATRSVFVSNAPGVVDPDYTGEIKVALHNASSYAHYLKHGDRIAQALIVPLTVCQLVEVTSLPQTERGARGFGSSGS